MESFADCITGLDTRSCVPEYTGGNKPVERWAVRRMNALAARGEDGC